MNRREPTIQIGSIMSNPTQKISLRTLTLFAFVVVLLPSIVYFGPTGWAEKRDQPTTIKASETVNLSALGVYGPLSFLGSIVSPSSLLAPISTITVNSTAQRPGIIGDRTLGEAIQAANTDLPVDGCSAGAGTDTIILPAGTYTLSVIDDATARIAPYHQQRGDSGAGTALRSSSATRRNCAVSLDGRYQFRKPNS